MIVPKSLHKDMKRFTACRPFVLKIKEKACDILYWPGINADLGNIVNSCDTCHNYQNQQKHKSPIAHDIPTTPWTKVGTNLF